LAQGAIGITCATLGEAEADIMVGLDNAPMGGRKVLVTHPEWALTFYPLSLQKGLTVFGNVWFERCFVSTMHLCGCVPFGVIEQAIVEVGVDTTVLSTDLGQPQTPPPAEGMRLYAERLRSSGFTFEHIRHMMCTNPAHLLSADGVAEL
jgi:hypothetical protein